MTEFTVIFNGTCTSGEHVHLTVTPEAGTPIEVATTKAEMLAGSPLGFGEKARDRIRSFIGENHTGHWPTTIAALEAATFKV